MARSYGRVLLSVNTKKNIMKSFKFLIVIVFNAACSTNQGNELGGSQSELIDSSANVNAKQKISLSDSAFIYKYFLDYDPATGDYGDLNEPTVHEYWSEKNNEALRYYKLATKLPSIPAYQRMIFANYLFDVGMENYVEDILATLNNRSDSVDVFYTMSSYGISFERFNIPEKVVKKYCPDIVYQ